MLGCNAKKPPKEIDPDSVYDVVPLYNELNSTPPYDYSKFQGAIDQSKFQYPHDDLISQGNLVNYKASFFYADSNATLHFTTQKPQNVYKTRSELRQINSWTTADTNGNYWVAKVQCLKPKAGITSYTWMQIHGTHESFNYPILRLFWERQRDRKYDHIWAVIIVSYPFTDKLYEYVDLGERPEGFFDAEVDMKDNFMTIKINNKVLVYKDVTYWENVINYYKAGIYINRYQDGGKASVLFKELHFYNNQDDLLNTN